MRLASPLLLFKFSLSKLGGRGQNKKRVCINEKMLLGPQYWIFQVHFFLSFLVLKKSSNLSGHLCGSDG